MRQIQSCSDDRNLGWCVFCGGEGQTRDHCPSRVLLDPFPGNLPVVPACAACNASFALDEEYLACLVECVLTGSVETACLRDRIGRILLHSTGLAERLRSARHEVDDQVTFSVERERVRRVLIKLARGHVAHEQGEPQLDEPSRVSFVPIIAMSEEQRVRYDAGSIGERLWPEVGSRALTRTIFGQDLSCGWIVVQPEFYRYRVEWDCNIRVQMVLREYLASEVEWP